MVVHIAPIGTETAHVIEWLRSGSVQKIYLLHSRKTAKTDFPKKARDLEKQIKKLYPGVEIIKRVIENAFNLDDTQDAISEIFYYETKDNKVQNQEIIINVTGGTNVQGAAAVLSAFKHGTKADYIRNRKKEKLKNYNDLQKIRNLFIRYLDSIFKKYFKNKDFKNSINISKNSLHLPSSTYLSLKQIKFICNKVKLFFK